MRFFVVLMMLLALPLSAAKAAGDADELVGGYKGSERIQHKSLEFAEFPFRLIPQDGTERSVDEVKQEIGVGRFEGAVYRMPGQATAAQIFYSYQNKLKEMGYEIMYTCTSLSCSGLRSASIDDLYDRIANDLQRIGFFYERYDPHNISLNKDPSSYYIFTAKKEVDGGTNWVTFIAGDAEKAFDKRYAIAVIDNSKLPEKRVETFTPKPIKVEDIQQNMDEFGKVAIYGIYFDFDKADLKPDSKPALDQIYAYLQGNPEARVIVTGHTDNVGTFEYNINLSNKRAAAVMQALVANYGVDASRLKSFGAGMAAPVSTNETDYGRAMNRRVELVKW